MITIDIRRGITELDDELLRWLRALELPAAVLLTKADKLSRGAGLARQHEVERNLDEGTRVVRFSSLTQDGVPDARAWLADWLGPGAAAASKP